MNESSSSALTGGKGRDPGGTVKGASSPPGEQETLELWGDLNMEEVLSRENMTRALKRVKENKGSAGADGMTVEELEPYLRKEWPRIRKELLEGRYRPEPVKRVMIPKPNGGKRPLGIPTLVDRLIHQAISPVFEKDFSESSYGYRRGKSAVDRPWRRKFLGYAVTMDKETRRRVSQQSIKRLIERIPRCLHRGYLMRKSLRNLGFLKFRIPLRYPACLLRGGSLDKLRDIFRGGRGGNIGKLVQKKLNPVIRGWKNYFKLSAVKWIMEELDGWIRRRLRCILWRQMKRGRTRARRLIKRGLEKQRAWKSAYNGRGAWWNAGAAHMNEAFPVKYFRKLGLVELKTGDL